MYRLIVVLGALFFVGETSYSQTLSTSSQADVSAEYPGGLDVFLKYVHDKIIYPKETVIEGIEGRLFVEFDVDTSGFIDEASVAITIGLHPACDREALRVVKSNRQKWKPARKRGKSIKQHFVLPVVWARPFTGNSFIDLEKPIPAIVDYPSANAISTTDWQVYGDLQSHQEVGKVQPEDTVEVLAWAPWSYYIKSKSVKGYVYWKALVVDSKLKNISEAIERNSFKMGQESMTRDSLRKIEGARFWSKAILIGDGTPVQEMMAKKEKDSIELLTSDKVALRLTSSKSRLVVGECTVLTLALYVDAENKRRLRFYEPGVQLDSIAKNKLRKDQCWFKSNNLVEITGFQKVIGPRTFTEYPIYEASYCPVKEGSINFRPITLKLNDVASNRGDSIKNFFSVVTKPLSIRVDPLPSKVSVTGSDFNKLVGRFDLVDSILSEKVFAGKPVWYSVTIKGSGLTFPLAPPSIKADLVKLIEIEDADTIINDVYYSQKTFTYSLTFQNPGEYDLSNRTLFSYYDRSLNKTVELRSKSKIRVVSGDASATFDLPALFVKDNIVALDISQSMEIEDCKPTRLLAASSGIQKFLAKRNKCDIGMIAFGGNAVQFGLATPDSCYGVSLIRTLDYKMVEPGTAIWDAIWLAVNSTSQTTSPKKLVIIGDGDNTAGFVGPAIEYAMKHRVKIFTIGIGHSGWVPYGKDFSGKRNMVLNTFSSKDFERISLQTGGRYYWAEDAESVAKILREIFSN